MVKKHKSLLATFLISFVLYFRSLFVFFTNDDFFHFVVSKATSLKDFFNFFNLAAPVTGFPNYRPIATQVFYFLDAKLFNLNPLPMHIVLFILFFGIIYFVYRLAQELFPDLKSKPKNQVALTAAFLYAVSATHFGQLYFVATQEIIYGFFFFACVLSFVYLLKKWSLRNLLLSFLFFILCLASKEPAVTLPFVLTLIYLYFRLTKLTKVATKTILYSLAPFFAVLAGYLYMRFFHYGFAKGDSYLWAFEPKRIINSLGWYSLWSLNIPEMLVDFVGPGLKFLPSLFKHYSKEIIPIFVLFGAQIVLLAYSLIKFITVKNGELKTEKGKILAFSGLWFVGTLVPVLFLPIHKFSFYLTVPLFGIAVLIAYLLSVNRQRFATYSFLVIWFSLSVLTLNLTAKTSWITRGEEVSRNVYKFLKSNEKSFSLYNNIVFFDMPQDNTLPWLPTTVVKTSLSDNNFFQVFFSGKYRAWYGKENYPRGEGVYIWARQFLGY